MKKLLLILAVTLCFTACRKIELYHDLTEEEANEMLVVLQSEGIEVNKVKEVRQNEVYWTVQVDEKRLADARRLLVENKLPFKREAGLLGVYKEKGLIPTPDEQKARYLLALKGEIINSLVRIPDVVEADVVLNIPTPDEFMSPDAKEKKTTASVVVKAKPSSAIQETLSESKIQQFVANSVENLNPRDVSVILTFVSSPNKGLRPGQSLILPSTKDLESEKAENLTRIAGIDVSSSSQGRLKLYLSLFFAILGILAGALIITIIRSSRMRQELDGIRGDNQLVEGKVIDEPRRLESGE